MQNLIGKTLGNYQIIEEIGRGGMAVVYKAYQPSLNRYVALKVLPPQFTFDTEFVQRFLQEARTAAGLDHPHIVTIYEVGEQEGTYYIAMQYVDGPSLKQLIEREGALPLSQAVRIVSEVADALDYAHQQGFVHRDVKPSNILLTQRGRAILSDFGIARAVHDARLTRTGMLVGTPEYMSPEQARGIEVDWRTDIYTLGVVCYEMLTGRVPFSGTTPHAVLLKHIQEQPPRLRTLRPSIPAAVERVVEKALAKDPEKRYQRPRELAAALEQTVGEEIQRREEQLQALGKSAQSALSRQDWQRTIALAQQMLALDPGHARAAQLLAEAKGRIEEETRQRQERLTTLYSEGQQALGQSQWARAADRFRGVLALDASYRDARAMLAAAEAGQRRAAGTARGLVLLWSSLFPWGLVATLFLLLAGCLGGILLAQPGEQFIVKQIVVTATPGPTATPVSTPTVIAPTSTRGRIFSLACSPDGRIVAAASAMGAWLYDSSSLEDLSFFPHTALVRDIAWSPDGERLALASDNAVFVLDAKAGPMTHQEHPNIILGVAWSPDNRTLAVGGTDNIAALWIVGQPNLRSLQGHTGPVSRLAWSPDGQRLASASFDSTVRVWDALTGTRIYRLEGHANPVKSVAWSPAEQLLASGGEDGIRIWDAENGTAVQELGNALEAVAWSLDGRLLASAKGGGAIQLWEVQNWTVVHQLTGHRDNVIGLTWCLDGQLVSASKDGTIRVWDPLTGLELAQRGGHT